MRTWTKPAGFAPPPQTPGDEFTLTCRFISPVFGGGVDPKRQDPVTPVRASAIRGQLRYWWRATHADLSLLALHETESKLFGGVHEKAQASAISLHVAKQPARMKRLEVFLRGSPFKLVNERLSALAYGAFPLRGEQGTNHDPLFVYDDPFEIVIRMETRIVDGVDVRLEIERALWAWLHFGGLGGRTRRGFGAVELIDSKGFTLKSIRDGWPNEPRKEKAEWPVLQATMKSVAKAQSPTKTGHEAQEKLLDLLRRMRQGDLGRTHNNNNPRPGRSYWPEPDAIRKICHTSSERHGKPIHDPRIDKFPRAAFGAPIIFHFKSEPGEREPVDTMLVPAQWRDDEKGTGQKRVPLDRFASSLILRPHAANGGYESMAVRLDHPEPRAWMLLEKKTEKAYPVIKLDEAEANRIKPLVVDKHYTDPIAAYFAHLIRI